MSIDIIQIFIYKFSKRDKKNTDNYEISNILEVIKLSNQKKVQEWKTVRVEKENGITWVIMNRPEKRNAMNPQMHFDMYDILTELDTDDETQVLVLTGAGESFSAGQDLKEYFRELENDPKKRHQVKVATHDWRHRKLVQFSKPTIACVNGWCFGGAFTQLISCDLAIAAEDATFGLSEINWGIIPGGLVTKVVQDVVSYRHAMYYILTGDTFNGKQAEQMGLVNFAVPRSELRDRVIELANKLKEKNPVALRACKEAYRACLDMTTEQARDYLDAKIAQLKLSDSGKGMQKGISQFIDEKKYRPGLGAYDKG